MASRLPIVASNVGAIPDFVHDGVTGFIVKPGDVNAMANALSTLISDPEKCRSFGEKGYQLAQRRYTWKAVGKRMHKHIMDVLSDCWDPIVPPKQEPVLPCQDSLLSQEMKTT
jgi:glycosyltransferase involved in cell wall biosynthesis